MPITVFPADQDVPFRVVLLLSLCYFLINWKSRLQNFPGNLTTKCFQIMINNFDYKLYREATRETILKGTSLSLNSLLKHHHRLLEWGLEA